MHLKVKQKLGMQIPVHTQLNTIDWDTPFRIHQAPPKGVLTPLRQPLSQVSPPGFRPDKLLALASEGRNEARGQASEASADQSDFPGSRRLVILRRTKPPPRDLTNRETQPLFLLFSF